MSRLVWDRPTDREFEVGVEKGALFVGNATGVPWSGLVSVEQSQVETDPQPRYQDGVRTHNHVPPPEFETTIEAYTYPDIFDRCLGSDEVRDGFSILGQRRETFGLVYQTKIGDAQVQDRKGVKLHLIYNAIATPNPVRYQSQSSDSEPTTFSWGIQTSSMQVPGFRPSSHFTLDSTRVGPKLFDYIYNRLYGGPGIPSRLLTPSEIMNAADNWQILYPSSSVYPSLDTLPGGP